MNKGGGEEEEEGISSRKERNGERDSATGNTNDVTTATSTTVVARTSDWKIFIFDAGSLSLFMRELYGNVEKKKRFQQSKLDIPEPSTVVLFDEHDAVLIFFYRE